MAQQKFLDLTGLTSYDKKSKTTMDTKDAATLASAKSYANSLGSNYDPAGTAQSKVDALEKGQVTTNKNDIATLKTGKADKSTTLAGYGIGDAYTKGQTDSAIKSAIANSGHLKRTIVTQLPEASAADEHTIYMIKKSSPDGTNAYDEYMVVNESGTKKLEKVGDSKVDLTNYATKTEVQTAKSEAINTASGDATTKANKALSDAKSYADGLAENYATAAQGAKADTALQKASITSGATNGSIAVGGTDVAVKGLGSAAYVATTAFDAAGVAESKVNALSAGQVTTNKNNIASLRTDVDNLKSTTYVAISTEEIDALFA
jgi:hypothetical protein